MDLIGVHTRRTGKTSIFTCACSTGNNKTYTVGEIDLEDGRTLCINRALGYKWQLRLNVRPEITILHYNPANEVYHKILDGVNS